MSEPVFQIVLSFFIGPIILITIFFIIDKGLFKITPDTNTLKRSSGNGNKSAAHVICDTTPDTLEGGTSGE